MEWVDSVRRGPEGWEFEVLKSDGSRHICGTEGLPVCAKSLRQPATKRRKVTLDLQTAMHASAQEYMDGLVFNQPVSDSHEVYAFDVKGTRYLIPTVVLMRAFFRPFAPDIIKLFYLPQGLDLLCTPDLKSDKPTVKVFEGMWPRGYREVESHLEALSWMHCFPSARTFAASPFEKVLQGMVGLALPKATASMVLHGISCGGTFFVTEVVVSTLVANEGPFDFAQGHPTRITLHDGRYPLRKSGRIQPARHPELKWHREHPVTDTEWAAIESILPRSKAGQQTPLRDVVNCILRKMSGGIPWRQSSTENVAWQNAQQHYRRWLELGVWGGIVAAVT